jgi:iron complex outermembrane receptor protein
MKRLRFIGSALLAVLWIAPLRAQGPNGTVRGGVTDDATKQPLAGVMITVGTRTALSQADGRYVVTFVPAGTYTLRARMLGYGAATQSVTVAGGQEAVVDLTMSAQAIGLSEIVVTGYGEQRAGDITGAVKEVTPEDFNPGINVNPMSLIQNKVAGAEVVPFSNEPGSGTTIRIRGATSVNASSDPLYVIDGVPIGTGAGGGLSAGRDPLNFLNPNDISSVTVLKDASAAAIYGANAANGVVIIQTKSGRRGTEITYSGSMSSSSVQRLPSMLTAAQFRTAVTQIDTVAPHTRLTQLGNANTDWFSLIDRTAFGQEHNLAVTSAGQSSNYRLSVGYLNQDGIIKGTNTQRISLGFNYDQRLFNDRLDVRTNLKGSRAYDQFTPGGVLSNAAQMGPTQPVRDSTSLTGFYNWPGNTLQSADNPLEVLNLASDHGTTYRSVGNVQADYRLPFFEALKANVNVGYDVTKADRENFYPGNLHTQLKQGLGGTDYRTDQTQVNTLFEAYLNYAAPLSFVPGTVDVTGGYSYAQSHAEYPSVSLTGLATNLLNVNGFPTANTVTNLLNVQDSKLISFFGRLNYNLEDRYLAAFSVRRDGSSRFGPSNAWGVFPSVSLAWRLSGEPFMRSIRGLSELKLRAAWGRTGNQAFANYQQYSAYTVGNAAAAYQFGTQFISTIRPSAVDPNIKWEETSSYNVGLDIGLMNQTVSGAIDWYVKKTSDLIFTVPVAAGTNFSNFLTTNIGAMENRGIEFSLNARLLRGGRSALGWTADLTAAHNTNKLTSINPFGGAVQQINVGGVAGGVGTTIQVLEPGVPINSFFVCRQYFQANKPVENQYLHDYTHTTAQGAVVTDSVRPVAGCSNTDRRAYHDPSPKWTLGASSYFTYGNLDLSFTLRAWLGNYVYNNVASNLGTYQEILRASPYNLNASVLKTGFKSPQYLSDYYVEDASFLRMDNITLGYTFSYHNQPMRVFATVQNAFTITGYSGVDAIAQGLNGIDNNIYPRSRTVSGGLTVRF